ncbi:MAG: HAD-IIIA family hydrolase [Bacteroidetes bacterium]|nr:HAD-IIIA family hydrolase [Bacteroidota bacterium]
MIKQELKLDRSWTLFLDRDGVLNKNRSDGGVKCVGDFVWEDGALESMRILNDLFGRIIVVTNQQAVSEGLITEAELNLIHQKMIKDVSDAGGKIDMVYYATNRKEENSIYRKPGIGMALKARKDFPEIRFKKSFMVGDTVNDMMFGKKLGMINALISNEYSNLTQQFGLVNYHFDSLKCFADFLKRICN